LRAGGSAADATIAALLVLNVVEPQSSGLGGGAFALVHGPDGLVALDGRETAPAAATPELFLDEEGAPIPWPDAVPTGRAVGVPGLAALLGHLHAAHGRLPWPALVAPADRLAREGFAVSPRLAGLVAGYSDWIAGTEAAELLLPRAKPIAEGEILRQSALAETLADLAFLGPDALYRGRIGEAIVAAVAAKTTWKSHPALSRFELPSPNAFRPISPASQPMKPLPAPHIKA